MSGELKDQRTKDIQDLNLSYLFCLREMAREDTGEAAIRFGVEQSLAKAIAEASVEDLRKMANPSLLQFKIRAPMQMRVLLRGDDASASLKTAISMISETV